MEEDYIFTQISNWENDLLEAYGETPIKISKTTIGQNIINKLIAFSKLSPIRSLNPDENTGFLLN